MIDSLGHRYGINSNIVKSHVLFLDYKFRNLINKLKGTNTTFLITADHGQRDIKRSNRINLNNIKGFHETLSLYSTGDSRVMYLFVRATRKKEFLSIWKKYLSRYSYLIESSKLVSMSYFGLGKPSRELLDRIGDYTLIAKRDYSFYDILVNENKKNFIGYHSGLTKEEMEIPLIKIHL